NQYTGFTASKYNPKLWVKLIKESGASYAVITSKHHDGVALWNTKQNERSIPKKTPAKKDVLTPFIDELKKENIKVGIYFSLSDWSDNNYPKILKDSNRYAIKEDTIRWKKFKQFFNGQLQELQNAYHPDLWWFDGDWEHSAEEWESPKVRNFLLLHNPKTIINSRLQGYGDYGTPEQQIPIGNNPYTTPWELCMTINDNWGYQPQDKNFKTPYQITSIYIDVISRGGNLLLDIGPKEDGTIPEEEINVLKALGEFNRKNYEAIFETIPGLPAGYVLAPTTMKKDSTALYVFLAKGQKVIWLNGFYSPIEKAEILSTKKSVKWKKILGWSTYPSLYYLEIEEADLDPDFMTTIKVYFDKPIKIATQK
ncbi:MAG: alpha-L-fucosidase, partial [Chitinophagaceae bacterium]